MSHEVSWIVALGKSSAIFVYFVLATVWFPSWVLGIRGIAGATVLIHDLAGIVAWLVPFVFGLWGLRRLQAAGWI